MWGEEWPAARLTPWPWLYSCLYWLILAGDVAETFPVHVEDSYVIVEA